MPKYPYETATAKQKAVGSWWWCVHHEIHVEPLTEPAENRVAYIVHAKPKDERDQRLQEFRPVLHPERIPEPLRKARYDCDKAWTEYGKAWTEYGKAWTEYGKAWTEYGKARADCGKAWAEYDKAAAEYGKAVAEYEPELMALHLEEYPDTKWNGTSIFGEKP